MWTSLLKFSWQTLYIIKIACMLCRVDISISYIIDFVIEIVQQWNQTIYSHPSHCHYCNVVFVLFYNITIYTNSLLSHIHVNIAELLNMTCTLIAIGVILGNLTVQFLNVKQMPTDVECWLALSHPPSSTNKKDFHGHGQQSLGLWLWRSDLHINIIVTQFVQIA